MIFEPQLQAGEVMNGPPPSVGATTPGPTGVTGPQEARTPAGEGTELPSDSDSTPPLGDSLLPLDTERSIVPVDDESFTMTASVGTAGAEAESIEELDTPLPPTSTSSRSRFDEGVDDCFALDPDADDVVADTPSDDAVACEPDDARTANNPPTAKMQTARTAAAPITEVFFVMRCAFMGFLSGHSV